MSLVLSGMAGIRDWLQKRFNSLDLVHASKASGTVDKSKSDCLSTVITPENTPDFVIPPSSSRRNRLVKQSQSMCCPSAPTSDHGGIYSSSHKLLKSSASEVGRQSYGCAPNNKSATIVTAKQPNY